MQTNRAGVANALANLFLRFFALNFNLRPSLNRYLRCDDGWFDFTFGISTENGSVAQAVHIADGRVRVLKDFPEKLDAQLVFVNEEALKEAATQPPNRLMLALMENRMITKGNLAYLQMVNFYLSLLLRPVHVAKLKKETKIEKRDYDPVQAAQKSISRKKRGQLRARQTPG